MAYFCVHTPQNAAPGASNIVRRGTVSNPKSIPAQGNPPATIAMQTAFLARDDKYTVDVTADPPTVVPIT